MHIIYGSKVLDSKPNISGSEGAVFSGRQCYSLWLTCTKMLHNTIKERQKTQKNNMTSLRVFGACFMPVSVC